ncbi:MAG: FtsX-like permease family protein [Solirubrobacteraceae bacterium]
MPIFLLSGGTPAYRNLQVGDRGKDVAELQAALRDAGFAVGDPEGKYGLSTAAAVSALYRAHGYTAPRSDISTPSADTGSSKSTRAKHSSPATAAMLPVWGVVYIKTLPATVAAIHAAVGARLNGGSELLTLTDGAPIVDLSVEPSVAATLRRGMRVRLRRRGGAQVWGRVHSVTTAKTSSSSSSSSAEGASPSAEEGGSSSAPGSSLVTVSLPAKVGITNSAVISVMERISEIGVRRALGARRGQIALQFLLENLVIGTIGGILGVCLGVTALAAVTLAKEWTPVLPMWVVIAAPLAGSITGLFAGVYPAIRAANADPVHALAR